MSYDFSLFRKSSDEGPITDSKTDPDQQQEGEGIPAFCTLGGLSRDQIKRKLADLLISEHPKFQEFQKDYQRIAQARSISEAEARQRYGHIELTDDGGLQVTLFDDSAAVTMPFWPNPETRFCTAWECLKLLESQGLFSTYNQQIGRILDLKSDFEVVRASYLGANGTVERTLRKK